MIYFRINAAWENRRTSHTKISFDSSVQVCCWDRSVPQPHDCNLASLSNDRRLTRNGIKEVASDAFNGTKMHRLWVTARRHNYKQKIYQKVALIFDFFSLFPPSLSGASVATSSLLTSTPTPLWVPVSWWYCKHDIQQWTHGYVIHRPHGRHHLLISGCRRERSVCVCVGGGWKKKKKNYTKRARFTVKINRAGEVINERERDFFFFFYPVYSQKKRHIFLLK